MAIHLRDGFEVDEANSAEEALKILSNELFSAVTVELIMPQMSGTDLVEEMHRRNIWTPAIITTAAFRRDQADAIPAMPGIVAWLIHPCTIEEILAALRKAVAQGPKPEPAH